MAVIRPDVTAVIAVDMTKLDTIGAYRRGNRTGTAAEIARVFIGQTPFLLLPPVTGQGAGRPEYWGSLWRLCGTLMNEDFATAIHRQNLS